MDAIILKNLTKRYEGIVAVDNLSLRIKKGEIFGLLGPNGAGKTTTLLMLSTLLEPTKGSAKVNGFDVVKSPAKVRESIGIVFQDPSSDELLTGYENLKLHALMYDVPLKEIDKRIGRVLSLVNLEKRKDELVKKYSGGMRRRMEIARGLLHEPQILFLDEPTLGLDPQTREHIWEYIQMLAEKMKMSIILTTHYMEEAERLCKRIAIMDDGKIIALDSPDRLKRNLGGDIVTLKGQGIDVAAIRRLSFVKKVKKEKDLVKISLGDSAKNLQKLLAVAGKSECVEVHSPTLNDVFLHYTGKQMREEPVGSMERLRTIVRARQK